MDDTKEIVIQLSKHKLALLLAGCFIFVTAGVFFIISPKKFESAAAPNSTFIFLIGLAGILFFGLIGIYLFKKLFDNKPGLVISEHGITDNSSGVSAGFIKWEDIAAIKELVVVNQKMINIVVKNPQDYIEKQKSIFKQKTMQTNYKLYGTVIGISANGLKISYPELKEIITYKFKERVMERG